MTDANFSQPAAVRWRLHPFCNGLRPYGIVPTELEALGTGKSDKMIDKSLSELTLNESMAALKPYQDRMSIIQGLSSGVCKGGHSGSYGVLGSYTADWNGPPRLPTVDAILAKQFPAIFPHLAFHVGNDAADQLQYLHISAQGKNARTPAYASPLLGYKDVFGAVATGDKAKIDAAANRNLMDFLVDDVKRVRGTLNSAEKEKLDHYLGGFEALRERQMKLAGMGEHLRKGAPPVTPKFSSETETERLEAHFDLAAAALVTGLTNVVTIRPDTLESRYTGLGLEELTVHGIGHLADDPRPGRDKNFSDGTNGVKARKIVRTFQMKLIAGLADKLNAVPEGNGTMLDNTVIVFLSDHGDRHHTNHLHYPLVVIGNLGEQLKTGRYLHYPEYNKTGHRTLANFWMSLQHAAGMPIDDFGQRDASLSESIDQKGPLAEFMA